MLTPPPSPLPPLNKSAGGELGRHLLVKNEDLKKTTGRRFTLAILLIPALLILVSISSTIFNPFSFSHHFTSHRDIPLPHPTTRLSHFTSSRPPPSKRDTISPSIPTVPTVSSSADGVVPTPFPAPFDLSLSWNFTTTSCQDFFLKFTQDDNFRRCRPFSFLLGTSSQFASSESNLTLINEIIWGTCNSVKSDADCQTVMKSYGSDLQTQCKVELQQNVVLVQEALIGFQLYEPMRQAGCLVDNSTNTYCFLRAVASTPPSDLYFYQLPYGDMLPNNTVPTCSSCIQQVLGIYGRVVAHPPSFNLAVPQNASVPQLGTQNVASSTIPLDNTYQQASELATEHCGSSYIQQVQQTSASGAINLKCSPLYFIGLVVLTGLLL